MHNRYDSIMTRIGYSYLPGTGHGPTTNEAISQFEQAIGYDLPEDYKTFVQKYGFTMGRGGTRFWESRQSRPRRNLDRSVLRNRVG